MGRPLVRPLQKQEKQAVKRLHGILKSLSRVSSVGFCSTRNGQFRIGTGEELVVLVHGFGLSAKSWLPFVIPHLHGRTFVALDLPGHGSQFEVLPTDQTGYLEQFAETIRQAIVGSGRSKVSLVGYSIGAFACLQYLMSYGTDQVSKYLHIDHSPYPGQGWQGAMHPELHSSFKLFLSKTSQVSGVLPDQKAHRYDQLAPDLVQAYYEVLDKLSDLSLNNPSLRAFDRIVKRVPWVGESSKQVVSWPWAVRVIEGYYSDRYDFRPTLKDIDIPTWVMGSDDNKLFPLEAMRYMANQIPDARLHALPGGHEMHYGSPIKFHRIFKDFLSCGYKS